MNCDLARFADIETILKLGGGNIFLDDKVSRRFSVIAELVDAVHYSTCTNEDEYQPEAEFVPCYAGSWEMVLASLVIDQDWSKIAQTAKELREEHVDDAHASN